MNGRLSLKGLVMYVKGISQILGPNYHKISVRQVTAVTHTQHYQ